MGVPQLNLNKLENPPVDHSYLVKPNRKISEDDLEEISQFVISENSKEISLTNLESCSFVKDS